MKSLKILIFLFLLGSSLAQWTTFLAPCVMNSIPFNYNGNNGPEFCSFQIPLSTSVRARVKSLFSTDIVNIKLSIPTTTGVTSYPYKMNMNTTNNQDLTESGLFLGNLKVIASSNHLNCKTYMCSGNVEISYIRF